MASLHGTKRCKAGWLHGQIEVSALWEGNHRQRREDTGAQIRRMAGIIDWECQAWQQKVYRKPNWYQATPFWRSLVPLCPARFCTVQIQAGWLWKRRRQKETRPIRLEIG